MLLLPRHSSKTTRILSRGHVVSHNPQVVKVCTALGTSVHRKQASAKYSKTSGTPLSRSSPNTSSTTQPEQHGRCATARLSCRTSTMTISWRRRDLPVSRIPPKAVRSSQPALSMASRRVRSSRTVLSYLAPPTNRIAICLFEIYGTTGSQTKNTLTPCLDSSKTTSTTSSRRMRTLLKPNSSQREGSWPTQRCKVGPARLASLLGQYDTECQCESPD